MKETQTVGVIVGRFQVQSLTEAHKALIQHAVTKHEKVILFLGINPIPTTKTNPLDFEMRKAIISARWKKIIILPIMDCYSDTVWSKNLDLMISSVIGLLQTAILYGSRDSFIPYYSGEYKTQLIELKAYKACSGTKERAKIGSKIKSNSDFRAGVIWATQNQYINATPCVDVAILKKDGNINSYYILLGKKENEHVYRFIGGHVDPGESFTAAAKREVLEETNLEITDIEYVGNDIINDWRHEKGVTGITTVFFKAIAVGGDIKPLDDINKLVWFSLQDIENNKTMVMPAHQHLLNLLLINLKGEI